MKEIKNLNLYEDDSTNILYATNNLINGEVYEITNDGNHIEELEGINIIIVGDTYIKTPLTDREYSDSNILNDSNKGEEIYELTEVDYVYFSEREQETIMLLDQKIGELNDMHSIWKI